MGQYKIIDDNGIYYTTHTIVEWMSVFTQIKYFQIIIESLIYYQKNKGVYIFGYVIMFNHLHLLV